MALAEIVLSERLTELHRYWLSKHGTRGMPARSDIQPHEIGRLISHVALIDEFEGKLRYRLVGARIAAAFGVDPSGDFLDSARYKIAARTHAMALSSARPVVSSSHYRTNTGEPVLITRLALPLSEDGIRANMVLAGLDLDRTLKYELSPGSVLDLDEGNVRLL